MRNEKGQGIGEIHVLIIYITYCRAWRREFDFFVDILVYGNHLEMEIQDTRYSVSSV